MTEKKSKLASIKTKPTTDNIVDFITKIESEQKRDDCFRLLEMMKNATGQEPILWSNSIIGFGKKIYTSPKTGRAVEWMLIGFASRKANITLNLTMSLQKQASLLEKLGKHKTGVGCLYLNKLEDIDIEVLEKLIAASLKEK